MSGARPLVLVARIVVRQGCASEVEAALQSLLSPTRSEPGCELYALHRDLDDPDSLVMLERWRSEADWQAHIATHHIAEFLAKTNDRLTSFHVTRLTEAG